MALALILLLLALAMSTAALVRTKELKAQLEALRRELHGGDLQGREPEEGDNREAADTHSDTPTLADPPEPAALKPRDTGTPARTENHQPETPQVWIQHLKQNWMIWLGGACVGLAGIFLVKYSMDQGILGPGARVVAGIVTGLLLHTGAGFLRKRYGTHPAFAALAAGGSITLFAALLAALHLYQFLSPGLVFILLALVAIATMFLAVSHGPFLAGIGMLGAYLVPLLIGGNSDGTVIVLVYSLIISASVLMLMHYVQRDWLWIGMLLGSLGWFLMTLAFSLEQVANLTGIYLAILAYLVLAMPDRDWRLAFQEDRTLVPFKVENFYFSDSPRSRFLPGTILVLCIAQCMAIGNIGFNSSAIINWLPMTVLLLRAANSRQSLLLFPWLLLVLQLAAWAYLILLPLPNSSILSADVPAMFYWYCLCSAAVYSTLAILHLKSRTHMGIWSSMATMAPLGFMVLAYLAGGHSGFSPWPLMAIALAGLYMGLTPVFIRKESGSAQGKMVPAWLFIAGHTGYSLAAAMMLSTFSFTLALAVQTISLAWIIRRFELPALGWLLKLVIGVVILRLTLNPWLLQYPADIHWSLWTFGGSTLCCFIAGRLLQKDDPLRLWTHGASLHLLVLTLLAETRYWMNDGNIFALNYSFTEAALNISLFGLLALVYHYREQHSRHLRPLYRIYSLGLMIFAAGNYLKILTATLGSQAWAWQSVGNTPLFNKMLLAFGMPVLVSALASRFYIPYLRKPALITTGVAAFVFISLQIRHLWHGNINLSAPVTSGELYTYSVVWLACAILLILGGAWRYGKAVYQAGMLLLLLVIGKLFLVDMAGLEGLLRVASFMGMGIGLLIVAFLYQKLEKSLPASEHAPAPETPE